MSRVVERLRSAAERGGVGRTDGELLTQFLGLRDEGALAALVERHAPMVWGVCCRLLRIPQDAEDAFQATFLVFVQKASSVRPRDRVANWLYGVARQTAVRLRATAAKRGGREVQMDATPESLSGEAPDEELLARLDCELGRLPERLRALIVLCDLEGHTRKEAARQLGCPEGTVASGLARARELLAKRLTRRGLAVSGGSLAATLANSAASAGVPQTVMTSAIHTATLFAAGKAAGIISGPVAALSQGVLKTMFLKKILATTVAVLALGVAIVTGGNFAIGQTEGKPAVVKDVKAPVAEKPVEPAVKGDKEKEPLVAWGKEVGGLQAGLSFKAGEKRAYYHGEEAKFVVKVRNVGKEPARVEYYNTSPLENPPTATDAAGKTQAIRAQTEFTKRIVFRPVLKPGEELDIPYDWKLELQPTEGSPAEEHLKKFLTLYGTGKFQLHVALTAMSADNTFTELGKLATGKLELEVKNPSVAWGEVVGGLQAGLSFKAGEKRAYHHGETVKMVIRLRNLGKEEIQVRCPNTFPLEKPPIVTDAAGKTYPIEAVTGFTSRFLLSPTLAPGQEIELNEWNLELRPASESAANKPTTLYATGKFQIQFPTLGTDPALSKLATGKLELEVQEEPKTERPKLSSGRLGPLPMAHAVGTTFTLARVTVADGTLSWTAEILSRKVEPKAVEVEENGVKTTKIVDNFISTWHSKKFDEKLSEFDITGVNGKVVPTDEVAKRLKGDGTLILLYNPLDEKSRKWFGDDALFFMPVRGKGEDRVIGDNKEWVKLTHEAGRSVLLAGVKAKDGVLSWTDWFQTGEVENVQEKGVLVTRMKNAETKYEAREKKLTEFKITGANGEAVTEADIEKRLKDGGVLVQPSVGKADRKLFATEMLFLELPTDGKIEIYSGPDSKK